jgi:hypothetical protein
MCVYRLSFSPVAFVLNLYFATSQSIQICTHVHLFTLHSTFHSMHGKVKDDKQFNSLEIKVSQVDVTCMHKCS